MTILPFFLYNPYILYFLALLDWDPNALRINTRHPCALYRFGEKMLACPGRLPLAVGFSNVFSFFLRQIFLLLFLLVVLGLEFRASRLLRLLGRHSTSELLHHLKHFN
jgi:hypothetical protein